MGPEERRFSIRLAYLNEKEDDSLETKAAEGAQEYIFNSVDKNFKPGGHSDYNEYKAKEHIGEVSDLRYARYIADTVTYENQSLSWKYGILSTYFRNMWFIFISSLVFYIHIYRYDIRFDILLTFLILGIICLQQRFKFKRRQIRTMINELAVMSNKSD